MEDGNTFGCSPGICSNVLFIGSQPCKNGDGMGFCHHAVGVGFPLEPDRLKSHN